MLMKEHAALFAAIPLVLLLAVTASRSVSAAGGDSVSAPGVTVQSMTEQLRKREDILKGERR